MAGCRTVYVLSVVLTVTALAPYVSSASESASQQVLLCTAMGYQWTGLEDQSDSRLSTNTPCIYCLLSSVDDQDRDTLGLYQWSYLKLSSLTPTQNFDDSNSLLPRLFAHSRAPPQIL